MFLHSSGPLSPRLGVSDGINGWWLGGVLLEDGEERLRVLLDDDWLDCSVRAGTNLHQWYLFVPSVVSGVVRFGARVSLRRELVMAWGW